MTTTYLETPCPRCGEKKLLSPTKSNSRLYSKCSGCNKKSLYIINEKVDGSKTYSIVQVGAKNNNMVRATFWIEQKHAKMLNKMSILPRMKSQIVREALDNYSHTLQYKP